MDIWLIQDGEKIGPIHDYEIRSRIEKGELPPTTPAWHEGLPAWKPLGEISLCEREFDRPVPPPDLPFAPPLAEPEQTPPPPPARPVLVRRFFARWFDLYLYAGIWWFAMWAVAADIDALLRSAWVIFLLYIPWFALETFLIHRLGTTPGKWLLGIRVLNDDSSLLSLAQATRRSVQVLFIGLGFGLAWGGLTLICQFMSYFTAVRFGRPLWDYAGGHRVVPASLRPLRIVTYVIALYGALVLQMMVEAPYIMPVLLEATKPFPSLHEQLEKNPPWQLPPRGVSDK